MGWTGLRPKNKGNTPDSYQRPGMIRDELQHVLGAAVPDCILPEAGAFGGKFTAGVDLNLGVSAFKALIGGKYHATDSGSLALIARRAQLVIARKNTATDSVAAALDKLAAAFPVADAGTVCRYIVNGDATIASSGGEGGGIITKTGTVDVVDGWAADYAGKGNGSTGHYTSANSTGFPTGAGSRTIHFFWLEKNSGARKFLWQTGYNVPLALESNASNVLSLSINGVNYPTGYTLEDGKPYYAAVTYDGTTVSVYVNGVPVYTLAITLTTDAAILKIGAYNTGTASYFSPATWGFIMLDNVCRTATQIAAYSNALLLPCRDENISGAYPTLGSGDLASSYHEYKFDETSGGGVADSAGTLNGTATNTTICLSPNGLGNARNFASNSDYINFGTFAWPSTFSVLIGWKPTYDTATRVLLGNRVGSSGSQLILTAGKPCWYNALSPQSSYQMTAGFGIGNTNFLAMTLDASGALRFFDGINTSVFSGATVSAGSGNLYLGYDGSGTSWNGIVGQVDYLLILPRAMSAAEINQVYRAITARRGGDIRAILPTDSIALGFVRTDATHPTEANDADYKFGRREGATGGNRRVFLGWMYVTTNQAYTWDNPFATENIQVSELWYKKSLADQKHSVIDVTSYSTSYYGSWIKRVAADKVLVQTGASAVIVGANAYTSGDETSGYIGCYAEVIE